MATSCAKCGAPRPEEVRTCPSCGFDNPPARKEEEADGIVFIDSGPTEPPPPPPQPQTHDPVDFAPPPPPEPVALPSSASVTAVPAEPAPPAWAAPVLDALKPLEASPAGRSAVAAVRRQPLLIPGAAAVVVAAIMGFSYLALKPPPPPPAPPPAAPAAAPAEDFHPSATFAGAPRALVNGSAPAAPAETPLPPVPLPSQAAAPGAEAPQAPSAPQVSWTFEGTVFDLLTLRPVYAAKLSLFDADGNDVGQAESGPNGHYKLTVPSGIGYTLKIERDDYTDRYVDEGDAGGPPSAADAGARKILMDAAPRHLPWVGNSREAVQRDLALIPKPLDE